VTDRLYYTDSYLADFIASVIAVDGLRVYLDRSAFYPTSGGQPHDTGQLDGLRVVDVIDEEPRVAHLLASPAPFSPEAVVHGVVDWRRRFDHMQQHTGQHLLSAVFEELFHYPTVSVHFGDTSSTLDLDTESLTPEEVIGAERRANRAVLENRSVTVSFEDAATVIGLRKPPDREGEIRLVTIDGLDLSACGGTHVRSTGEIGPVMIRRIERVRKQCRVEFLCGWRALARSRADFDALTRMATTMSAGIDDLHALVESQAESLRAAESERRKQADAMARYRAHELHAGATADASGVRRIVDRSSPIEELRAIAQALSRLPRTVFVGATQSPGAVVFAVSADMGINAGAVLKSALAAHGGRGGGAPQVAQGTVADAAALEAIVSELLAAG
jgi:alanyl-tRNA synthetase